MRITVPFEGHGAVQFPILFEDLGVARITQEGLTFMDSFRTIAKFRGSGVASHVQSLLTAFSLQITQQCPAEPVPYL